MPGARSLVAAVGAAAMVLGLTASAKTAPRSPAARSAITDPYIGFVHYYFNDPDCPGNPDTYDYYAVRGQVYGGGFYGYSSEQYIGTNVYLCAGVMRGTGVTFPSQCGIDTGYGYCPCAWTFAGGTNSNCPDYGHFDGTTTWGSPI